ncbi:MAG TPA: hypothetical protein VGP76_05170, partial [Planctomycetaceae bacterium]|nr:hypothetical protein [Planctomycetaceae bacterium]
MNRFNGNDPGLRKFDLHGVKEERTLRTRFAFFAITAAGVGTLAALSGRLPLHADDAPVAGPAVGRAIAPAESAANQAYKRTAKNILAEADRLAAAGQLQKAAVLARRAAALPVQWKAGERTPQQLLTELAAHAAQSGTAVAQNDSPSVTAVKKQRYVSALLDTARDDLQLGRLDLAKARAVAAQKIENAYKFLDSRAGQLLVEIDRLSHRSKPTTPAASEPLVVRGQSPSAAESQADFQDFDKSGQPKAPVAPPAPSAGNAKAQAKRLLAEARIAFNKGAYNEARINALKADEFDVKWDVLEDQPQTLLAEIERTTGTKTFARRTKRPTSESTDPLRSQAVELIRQARADLQAGRFADATKKAQQARQLNAVFGMFEDRPDTVLADIARAQRVHDLTAGAGPKSQDNWGDVTGTEKQTGATADSQKAQDLLLKAREDLRAGHVDAARQKAQQVAKMNVAYTPFDDRPELVLESISLRETQSGRPVGPDGQPSEVRQAVAQDSGEQSPFTVNQVSHQAAPPVAPNAKWNKERATNLVREARQALKHGRIAEARSKAKEAATLDVAYSVMDDRPELVLSDIDRAEAEGSVVKTDAAPALPVVIDAPAPPTVAEMPPTPTAPPVMAAAPVAESAMPSEPETPAPSRSSYTAKPAASPSDAFTSENPFSGERARPTVVPVIAPSGASADELFELGMRELREGHRDNAYAAFLQCYRSGQQLERLRDRQLHDFLRDLAPLHSHNVQQVSAQLPSSADSQPRRQTASRIDIADQQRALKFEKLRTDVLNAHFKAERVKDSDPAKAIKLLDDAIAAVDRSDLGKEAVAPLMTLLARSKADIEAQQKTQAPVAAVKAKNEQMIKKVGEEQAYHVRVEQEFADLVEEYNKLCKQDRWTEAEQIAKQAKELDKENPTAE